MVSPILAVSDVDASIAFYTQKLGFQHNWSMPPGADVKPTSASVKLGDAEILLGTIEGYVEPQDVPKRGTGIQLYIALPADADIDALYQRAQANGVNITRPIEDRD